MRGCVDISFGRCFYIALQLHYTRRYNKKQINISMVYY